MSKPVFVILNTEPGGYCSYLASFKSSCGFTIPEWADLEDADAIGEESIAVFETEVAAGVVVAQLRKNDSNLNLEIQKATRHSYIDF